MFEVHRRMLLESCFLFLMLRSVSIVDVCFGQLFCCVSLLVHLCLMVAMLAFRVSWGVGCYVLLSLKWAHVRLALRHEEDDQTPAPTELTEEVPSPPPDIE